MGAHSRSHPRPHPADAPSPPLPPVFGVWVYRVDPARNLLWVRGQVPGHAGNWVYVRDDVRRLSRGEAAMQGLPFPTHVGALPPPATAAPDKPRRPGEPMSL